MKYLILALILICQLTFIEEGYAQKTYGELIADKPYTHTIEESTYHHYELSLKKDVVVLLNMTDFDVRTELTVVSPEGIILDQVRTDETADFLIFKSPKKGNYQFYVNAISFEKEIGTYTLTAHLIPANSGGALEQIKALLLLLERPGRAGVATAIVENGKIIFEQYYGYSNVEHRIKNNAETVFELASVSKQFTAMAIARLAEQDKLSIEDDIRIYFPELPNYKSPIQIKHLLNHTSGIIDSDYPLALAGFENDKIELERVLNILKHVPDLYFAPGSAFAYSNDGYTLLAELVRRITKQEFKTWMAQYVFEPLHMESTLIRDSPEIVIPNRATSYVSYTGDSHFRRLSFDFFAPGGCSVRSNISDLTKWVDYLNTAYHSEDKLFKTINQTDTLNTGEAVNYAYGSFITDFRGLKRFSHLGLSAGFTTSIARFPDKNIGFIMLGNDGHFRNYYVARKLYEIYLNDHIKPIATPFEGITPFMPEQTEENQLAFQEVNLTDYEGTYFSQQINTSYTFEVIMDTLFALSTAYKAIPIITGTKDTLQTDEDFMERLVFKRDYTGKVSEVAIFNDDDNHSISFIKISDTTQWPKTAYWKSTAFQQIMKDTLVNIEASKILTGFAVSVFDESETFLQEGYGYATVEDKKRYNPETIQLIASVSKSITGMAVMKAMELGFFKLDDPIQEHLPFMISNPDFPDEDITIRQLLTHTSSLSDPENYNRGYVFRKSLDQSNWPQPHHEDLFLYNNNEKVSLSDFLDSVASPKGKWYNKVEMYTTKRPGTHFEYSNMGFALLGYIMELTTGLDFMEFTQKHIFDPLDMNSSTWELEKVESNNHATYYLENYNSCPDYSINTIPDGGLYTNIIDLTKFLQEAIRGYAGRGKVLSQSSYKEMFRRQSHLIEIEGGLGWDLSISCCIGHAGNDFGVSTVMYFEPSTGIGRIVFSNISSETEEIEETFYGIMNLLFTEGDNN